MIGVRIPALRALAKELAGTAEAEAFLEQLPHRYYEEDNLHGFLLERVRDYDTALARVEAFLPWVDNWATCDTTSPKVFARHTDRLLEPVRRWIASGQNLYHPLRPGDADALLPGRGVPARISGVGGQRDIEEYYVRMMVAWFFATALAKQPDAAWPWVAEARLSPWVRGQGGPEGPGEPPDHPPAEAGTPGAAEKFFRKLRQFPRETGPCPAETGF